MDHLLNLFRISNAHQLNLHYRLIEVSGLPESRTLHQNLQKVKTTIAYEYGTPVVLLRRGERRLLAVAPTTTKQSFPAELDVSVLQGLVAHLSMPSNDIHTLRLDQLEEDDVMLATTFLGWAFRSTLRERRDIWQGASSYLYYDKTPIALPGRFRQAPVALYPGFSYRVISLPDAGLCVAADIVHMYTDTRMLADRIDRGEDWRSLTGRHFIYEFGPRWYPIQLQEVSNHSIAEARFTDPREPGRTTDVYTYTIDIHGRTLPRLRTLRANDRALVYNYPNRSRQQYGAVSLARLRYQTDDAEVAGLHRLTILEPEERMARIQEVIATAFDGRATVDDVTIKVCREPLSVPAKIFPMPVQRFGHDQILPAPAQSADDVKAMWRTRAAWLRNKQIGPLTRNGIRSQYLLVPLSLAEDEALLKRMRDDLVAAVDQLSPVPYRPTIVVWNDQRTRTLPQFKQALADAKHQMERSGVACALVVLPTGLPRSAIGKLRRHIKRMLYPNVRTKCVQATALLSHLSRANGDYQIAPDQERRYRSYLYNTALDLLVTSRYWPWALAEPLQYDLYVGVDVLNNTAGFTFVGANGAICRFVPLTSEQKEKLLADQMVDVLLHNLRDLIPRIRTETEALPRHLVIHRDGLAYPTELEGIRRAVTQLQGEGLLPADVHMGVVEIHKSNAERLRLFGCASGRVVNPWIGAYHVQNNMMGLICTTGYPGLPNGTAEPIIAKIVAGDLEIARVLQDIYWLSILSWTKPDGLQSGPITIKLSDSWLEPIAARVSDSDELFDDLDAENELEKHANHGIALLP